MRSGLLSAMVSISLCTVAVYLVTLPAHADPGTMSDGRECILEQTWEGGFGLWESDGVWEVGVPTASPPSSAYEGSKLAGTNLSGHYPATSTGRLTRTNLVLPPIDEVAGESIRLRFYQFFRTYDGSDYGCVQVDSGGGWENVFGKRSLDGEVWSPAEVELSPYADKTIDLCFYFRSQDTRYGRGDEERGWYVDSVTICKRVVPPFTVPEEFQNGCGDWFADNGLWHTGEPTSGPGRAYRGHDCAATNLHGHYPAPSLPI
jgi:hypothetical protein